MDRPRADPEREGFRGRLHRNGGAVFKAGCREEEAAGGLFLLVCPRPASFKIGRIEPIWPEHFQVEPRTLPAQAGLPFSESSSNDILGWGGEKHKGIPVGEIQ